MYSSSLEPFDVSFTLFLFFLLLIFIFLCDIFFFFFPFLFLFTLFTGLKLLLKFAIRFIQLHSFYVYYFSLFSVFLHFISSMFYPAFHYNGTRAVVWCPY
jgi:hypothetical protein